VAQVWPIGIDQIGPKIYFFFMAVNLVCVPVSCPPVAHDTALLNPTQIIYILYPETKGRSLEDMDSLFGRASAVQDVHDELDLADDPAPDEPANGRWQRGDRSNKLV